MAAKDVLAAQHACRKLQDVSAGHPGRCRGAGAAVALPSRCSRRRCCCFTCVALAAASAGRSWPLKRATHVPPKRATNVLLTHLPKLSSRSLAFPTPQVLLSFAYLSDASDVKHAQLFSPWPREVRLACPAASPLGRPCPAASVHTGAASAASRALNGPRAPAAPPTPLPCAGARRGGADGRVDPRAGPGAGRAAAAGHVSLRIPRAATCPRPARRDRPSDAWSQPPTHGPALAAPPVPLHTPQCAGGGARPAGAAASRRPPPYLCRAPPRPTHPLAYLIARSTWCSTCRCSRLAPSLNNS